MRQRIYKPTKYDHPQKQGWDMLLKDYEMRQKGIKTRSSQRHISMGMGHHLARMMKGHV